jgi:hypothetical protein
MTPVRSISTPTRDVRRRYPQRGPRDPASCLRIQLLVRASHGFVRSPVPNVMSEPEERAATRPGTRVEQGEFFVEQMEPDGRWAFGRGHDVLLTGLTHHEALLLLARHAGGGRP